MASKKKKSLFRQDTIIGVVLVLLLSIVSVIFFSQILFDSTRPPTDVETISGSIHPPVTGAYLGISLFDENIHELLRFEKKLKKRFSIIGRYQSWGDEKNAFPTKWANQVIHHQSIPFITWEPWKPVAGFDRSEDKVYQEEYLLKHIVSGKYDIYIHTYAKDAKAFKKQLFLRFAHEMNGNWYSWGSTFNTPEEYIAAWRHVHRIFHEEGATNVTWVWSPNELYENPHVPNASQIEKFYPGDAYVDWVGFSAFNWAGKYKENTSIDPEYLYTPTLTKLLLLGKPILITETASAETGNWSEKARWVELLANYLKSNPEIKGFLWFDIVDNGIDWKIGSNPLSLTSFEKSFDEYFLQYYSEKDN